jgi:hypothetical protein
VNFYKTWFEFNVVGGHKNMTDRQTYEAEVAVELHYLGCYW